MAITEQTIMTFNVDTLHGLATAVTACIEMVRARDKEPVDIRLELLDLGGDYQWLKLIEEQRPNVTFYVVRLENSDG